MATEEQPGNAYTELWEQRVRADRAYRELARWYPSNSVDFEKMRASCDIEHTRLIALELRWANDHHREVNIT